MSATDYDSLVALLLEAGLAVEETEEEGKTQLFFTSATARHLLVSSAKVLVYEYSDSVLADADAAGVSSDGGTIETPGNGGKATMMISWISAPHFYKSGRIIALYVGIVASINEALEAAMGPQFAGGR